MNICKNAVYILFFVFFIGGCSNPKITQVGQESNNCFQFAVVADPQVFWGNNIDNWRQTIEQINLINPDLVVVCGDMTEMPGDSMQIETYLDIAGELNPGISIYELSGNHDVGSKPTLSTLYEYKDNYGALYYAFSHKDVLFILLESSSIRTPNDELNDYIDKQMQWLRDIIHQSSKYDYKHKFVFMHHPIILQDIDEPEEYFNMPIRLREELLSLFIDGGIDIVFSGHYHQDRVIEMDEIELVVNGSCGKALGQSSLGFRVVNVCCNGLSHEYITLPDQSLRYAD